MKVNGYLIAIPLSPVFSLLGYRPFVEACVDADEKGEALKYIPKLTDPRERAEVSVVYVMIFPHLVYKHV